jgi:Formyl transferase
MRSLLRILYRGGAWNKGHLAILISQNHFRSKNVIKGYTDDDHLHAAGAWLERAQDATRDGGVAGRYDMRHGWTSSYPETTGYIIPTMLKLADHLSDRFFERAERCKDFLLGVQLENGGFPGGEIAENSTAPSPFNTAQIIHGLVEWHKRAKEDRVLNAAYRAGKWLVSIQENDGTFFKHYYKGIPACYSAHLSCWLGQLGKETGEQCFLKSAERHLNWLMQHYVPTTGWFELSGFDAAQHRDRIAYTHTIAYTLWGILYLSEILNRSDGINAVVNGASQILRRAEISQRLPGLMNWEWRSRSEYTCPTGNVQLALIWFRLFERLGDARYLNIACKAIDWVKRCQSMDSRNPGILGGIPGSDPIWGDYIRFALPNWAAKYFIDALIRKREIVARPWEPSDQPAMDHIPRSIPRVNPHGADAAPTKVRLAMLTTSDSLKVPQMMHAWSSFDIRPDVVFVQTIQEPRGILAKALEYAREFGLRALTARILVPKRSQQVKTQNASPLESYPPVRQFCHAYGIATIDIGALNTEETLRQLRETRPDLLVHAGGGILRQPVLSIPRLGTVNAHMGLLPHYRGMNVAEWAALNGDVVGCSVHLIDSGIDTGDILCDREVGMANASTVSSLRHAVDVVQIELLGEVIDYVLATGQLPPRHPQKEEDGRQFFRMHSDLLEILERRLSANHAETS